MSRDHARDQRRGNRAAKALAEAAPVFAALGDQTRLRLVGRLAVEGPLSIAQLSDGADVTRQAITKHLQSLADAGVVSDSKRGRERIWELDVARVAKAKKCLDQISTEWDNAIERLRAFVEPP